MPYGYRTALYGSMIPDEFSSSDTPQSSDTSASPVTSGQASPPSQTPPSQTSPLPLSFDSSRDVKADVGRLVREGLSELEQRKRELQREIEQLERRKERISAEMRTSFAGASQDLAIRIQGFKDYLVGSLQDLASAAEQLELAPPPSTEPPRSAASAPPPEEPDMPATAAFAVQRFEEQRERVRSLIDQYRTRPDYYGPPWQLRRTFEPVHAERVSNWFFTQGGRGAVKSMGSRLQNVLVASAAISALYTIYGDRLFTLVLANSPERLGEWRRWLQDCLGISRADFGTNRGIMLFEAPEPMAQRAERLLDNGRLPLMIIDESENKVALSVLQFPLWLAFAPDPANPPTDDYYY
ncbi:MAG: DUF3086 domain-containing protein [Cyanobacteria bacterium J06635_1]